MEGIKISLVKRSLLLRRVARMGIRTSLKLRLKLRLRLKFWLLRNHHMGVEVVMRIWAGATRHIHISRISHIRVMDIRVMGTLLAAAAAEVEVVAGGDHIIVMDTHQCNPGKPNDYKTFLRVCEVGASQITRTVKGKKLMRVVGILILVLELGTLFRLILLIGVSRWGRKEEGGRGGRVRVVSGVVLDMLLDLVRMVWVAEVDLVVLGGEEV
jgi:hypothetical protein